MEAIKNNRKGLQIHQSAGDKDGVHWTEEKMGDWLFSLYRAATTLPIEDRQTLKDLLDQEGGPLLDNLRRIARSKEMEERKGIEMPTHIVKFVPSKGRARSSSDEEEAALRCPVPNCKKDSRFGSVTAQRNHIRKFHSKVASRYLANEKVLNPRTNRLGLPSNVGSEEKRTETCEICHKLFPFRRIKKHLEEVHKCGPYSKKQTVRFLKNNNAV